MQVSKTWLQTFFNQSLDQIDIENILTMAGLEVDEVKSFDSLSDLVVVAEVVSVEKHPDADRLNVCQVNAGQSEHLQIVCGAPNVRAGLKVPCALVGAKLADFENTQGKDLSEAKMKEYKDTSKRWVEMGPEMASVEIQNWRQKRRFDEALSIFELLKSEDKGFSTAFDQVFVQDLIQKLEERISNPLTQRKLSTVFRRTSKLKLPSGAYHLSGTSRISGQNIYVNITLKDKANRTTSWSGYITRSSLGSNLAFENLNYKNELEALRSTDRQGDLNLSLTTSFGDDPVLRFKDVWQLKVKVNKPAWLFCFYYMNNKETLQIYPNHATWQYFGGPKIPAGREISIPRHYKMDEAKVTFVVSEPAGYELVKCFATTRDVTADLPAQLLGKDAIDMGAHKAPPVLTNEIDKILSNEFRRHSPNVAEASIAVTVISGK